MPISKALIVDFGKKACISVEDWKMLHIKYGPGGKTITLMAETPLTCDKFSQLILSFLWGVDQFSQDTPR